MEALNSNLIKYLADLSSLTDISEESTAQGNADTQESNPLLKGLEDILSYMARLNELDMSAAPDISCVLEYVNVFRDDTVIPSFDRELIMQNAPVRNDKMFVAPIAIE